LQRILISPQLRAGSQALRNVTTEVPHLKDVQDSVSGTELVFKTGIVPDEDYVELVTRELITAGVHVEYVESPGE
jgi:hypothetical protein